MNLSKLASSIELLELLGKRDQEIAGIAYHSKSVEPGFLFVAISGFKTDGHLFVEEAIRRGAGAVVVERRQNVPEGVAQLVVADTRIALAALAHTFFDKPTSKLKLIGITGTNGKTTTAKLIESIFAAKGQKTGLLGTIEYKIGEEALPVDRTTPESCDLQRIFSRMVSRRVQVAVMEVSSHAVALHRIDHCQFDALVFTNLSQDHLDYHGTMEEYFAVKKRLFADNAGKECRLVVNVDDAYGQEIAAMTGFKKYYYGLGENCEIVARNIVLESKETSFELAISGSACKIDLELRGLFNVYNSLAAAAVAAAFDIPLRVIKQGLEAVANVPGRFEVIDCGQNFAVIVDYAHTPDGLEKLLSSARGITKGRLITIFGCGGDRDMLKRPLMGKISNDLSDYSIITSDNPRSEDPGAIVEQIEEGFQTASSKYTIEMDRKSAIRRGIGMARKGDCVIIAGKGHETYQEFRDRTVDFDDRAVARRALGEWAKCSQ
jgi:UDP-N-acetylmuramoyl-L-alanyl-D-glutamate--2,6-diaminopimelate ligase